MLQKNLKVNFERIKAINPNLNILKRFSFRRVLEGLTNLLKNINKRRADIETKLDNICKKKFKN